MRLAGRTLLIIHQRQVVAGQDFRIDSAVTVATTLENASRNVEIVHARSTPTLVARQRRVRRTIHSRASPR